MDQQFHDRVGSFYQDFFNRRLITAGKEATEPRFSRSWSHHLASFTVDTMTWLTIMQYLYQMTTNILCLLYSQTHHSFHPHNLLLDFKHRNTKGAIGSRICLSLRSTWVHLCIVCVLSTIVCSLSCSFVHCIVNHCL